MSKKTRVEWLEFSWPGAYPIQCLPPQKAWVFDFAEYGFQFSKMAVTFTNDTLSFYVIKKEYEEFGRTLFEKVLEEPRVLLQGLDQVNRTANKIFELNKLWSKLNFRKNTNNQLLKYHSQLFSLDEVLWRQGQLQNLLEMHNNYVTTYIRKNLKKIYGSKKELEYFQIISTPRYYSMTERQDDDLLQFAHDISSIRKLTQNSNMIKNHWLKYRWMTYGWTGPEITQEAFKENFKSVIKRPKLLDEIQKRLKVKGKNIKKQSALLSKFPPKLKQMSIVLRSIMEAKARRIDAHSLTYFLADPLLKEIGRRLSLSLNQLRVMFPPRVRTLFGGFNINEINEEIKFVTYWFEPQLGIRKLLGSKARNKMKQVYEGLPKIKKKSEVFGEFAYPGKVIGKVRIILNSKDIKLFKKGEILVTGMTDPAFVPAIKKAKALVTNSGGITCHAAIVSRELNVPCVIGTKFATKIFKDGDKVEVDATKGVVRKL